MKLNNILALDVGEARVGVAVMTHGVRVARPLTILQRQDDNFWENLSSLLNEHEIEQIVIGLPRNLNGDDTDQTRLVRVFAGELKKVSKLPQSFQDEALTSKTASLPGGNNSELDARAASLILSDYLEEQK